MRIRLEGCKVHPLGSYLKGIGIFKLVSEQLDPEATALWENDSMVIDSSADRQRLIDFFSKEYQPTPILSPWNSGSGFYEQKANVLKQIQKTDAWRFSLYRDVISSIQSFPELKNASKNSGLTATALGMTKEKFKLAIIRRCEGLDPVFLQWLHSVLYLDGDKVIFNRLFESGGNDGQLDYSGTFLRYIAMMLVDRQSSKSSPSLLSNALFGDQTNDLVPDIVGKWYPAIAGGYNMGAGIKRDHFPINPWDFILTLEGTLMWSFGVTQKNPDSPPLFPFVVGVSPFGYPSASLFDASNSCEIWLPVWNLPLRLDALKDLFRESLSAEKPARSGMQFAAALSGSGMEHLRYVVSMRRGQSYSSVLVSRYHFPAGDAEGIGNVLNDIPRIDAFLRRFSRVGKDISITSPYHSLRIALGNAFFEAVERPGSESLNKILRILGRIERYISSLQPNSRPAPLSGLSPEWITLADDGSLEYRIASALASIGQTGIVPPIRPYLEPVNDFGKGWDDGMGRFAWTGRSLSEKMLSVLLKRSRDALYKGVQRNPFWSPVELPSGDIGAFIAGSADDSKIEELLFGVILASHSQDQWKSLNSSFGIPISRMPLPPSFSYLKTLFLPRPVYVEERSPEVTPGPALLSSMEAGRYQDALRDARQRLASFGLTLNPVHMDSGDPARVAGALLLPVRFQGRMVERALT